MQVTRLTTTAIKGTGLRHPETIELRRSGAVGDRQFFLVDDEDRLISCTRTGAFVGVVAELTHELVLRDRSGVLCRGAVEPGDRIDAHFYGAKRVLGRVVPGPWAAVLSELAGQPVKLVMADDVGSAIDVAPVTLLGSASVDYLSRQVGESVDARRFRMLVELATDEPHVEDRWRGRRLRGQHVELLVGDPVPRCAAINRAPNGGARDLSLVHGIRAYRGVQDLPSGPGVPFGVYALVLREGQLRVGDSLVLVPSDSGLGAADGDAV
jgi:uncharacterized protein YcbX